MNKQSLKVSQQVCFTHMKISSIHFQTELECYNFNPWLHSQHSRTGRESAQGNPPLALQCFCPKVMCSVFHCSGAQHLKKGFYWVQNGSSGWVLHIPSFIFSLWWNSSPACAQLWEPYFSANSCLSQFYLHLFLDWPLTGWDHMCQLDSY